MSVDILPDSRAKSDRGEWFHKEYGWMVPVYCANCAKPQGSFSKHGARHFFILCDKCVAVHGEPAGAMKIPDEVFWQAMNDAQLEEHGRFLTGEELYAVAERNASPLARLINEGRAKGILV